MGSENTADSQRTTAGTKDPAPQAGLHAIDFSTFILSLSTSALHHMGLVPDPETGHTSPPNLVIAQQTIDTLEMLRAKTRGNLDEAEEQLITSLLYELRVRFVDAGK
jgi:hypothetical protein